MIHALGALVAPAVLQRLVLVANHVLASEDAATRRLMPHRGRTLQLQLRGWPALLPAPPSLVFAITPAGLLEWTEAAPVAAADLQVVVDAANPALLGLRLVAGETPAVEVQGDAALAADVNWLLANLRWDVEGDLERVVGARVAHELVAFGRVIARGLRAAAHRGASLASTLRS